MAQAEATYWDGSIVPYRDKAAIVADDHELFRAAMAESLRRNFGFRSVDEAGSFDEAIDAIGRSRDVSLACIDLSMPGMHGAESLHEVRQVFPFVKVVAVTGSVRRDDILQALAAGVHGYVPKTLSNAEINAALRIVLEGNIFVPPSLAARPTREAAGSISPPSNGPGSKIAMAGLSPRQNDVLGLMAQGKSNKEIARVLNLAEGTVKVHVAALYRTLGAHNRVSAVSAMTRLRERIP